MLLTPWSPWSLSLWAARRSPLVLLPVASNCLIAKISVKKMYFTASLQSTLNILFNNFILFQFLNHGKGLLYVRFEGGYLISYSPSHVKLWDKDTKQLVGINFITTIWKNNLPMHLWENTCSWKRLHYIDLNHKALV